MKTLLLIEILLILGLLTLSGCGRGLQAPTEIDPAFQAYADRFDEEAKVHGSDARVKGLTIEFATLDGVKTGYCSISDGRKIQIDPEKWNGQPDFIKEEIIFHELGHCILNRGHNSAMEYRYIGMVAVSLMNPGLPSSEAYLTYREGYIDELLNYISASQNHW